MSSIELTGALPLCTCPGNGPCNPQCPVCNSWAFAHGPCVRQLWAEHVNSDAGKLAAQRFNDMVANKPLTAKTPLTDDELAEQAIDWIEEQGLALQPWQATMLRAVLTGQAKLRNTGSNTPPGW